MQALDLGSVPPLTFPSATWAPTFPTASSPSAGPAPAQFPSVSVPSAISSGLTSLAHHYGSLPDYIGTISTRYGGWIPTPYTPQPYTGAPGASVGSASGARSGGPGAAGSGSAYPPLDQNPGVVAARNAQAQGTALAKKRLAAARRAAIIRFGLNPKDEGVLKGLGFAVDPTDIAAAEENYRSGNALLARLDKQNELANRNITNNLAARGMLFSGDTGYLAGQQASAYGNQMYDAQNQLTDYLGQIAAQELDQEIAYQQAVDQALADAWAYQQQQNAQYGAGAAGGDYGAPAPSGLGASLGGGHGGAVAPNPYAGYDPFMFSRLAAAGY
jgi:hypothetical protein